MATRKQSNPNGKAGAMAGFSPAQQTLGFAGPDDRKPAQLPALGQIPGQPGLWSYADRQRYVDSKPGTMMYQLFSTESQNWAKRVAAEIDARQAERKRQRDDEVNSRRRY